MMTVGVRQLKNRLTYYLSQLAGGERLVVTNRGKPIVVMHSLEAPESNAPVEERLASLAKKGWIRLPSSHRRTRFIPLKLRGTALSEIVIKDRR